MPMNVYLPPRGRARRSLLKRGLIGGALLALGGGSWLAFRGTRRVPLPPEGLQTFSEDEYSVLDAVARRFVQPLPGFPTVEEVRVAYNADRILSRGGDDLKRELKQLIGLFENGLTNFVFGLRPTPFTQLSGEQQDTVLRAWRDSRIEIRRTGYRAMHILLMTAYYGSPVSWKAVGYGGPPEGFHQPTTAVWKGGGEPRPPGNGVYLEPAMVTPEPDAVPPDEPSEGTP